MDEMKRINDAAEKVLAVCGQAEIGIILGSGLGDYAEALEDAVKLPYSEIPGFPRSTVAGHAGMWCCGMLHGKRVVMTQGRLHYAAGHAKDVSCAGSQAKRRVKLTFGQVYKVNAGHLNHPGQFPCGQDRIHIPLSVHLHPRTLDFVFLGRTRHYGYKK